MSSPLPKERLVDPKTKFADDMDQCYCPSLDLFRDACKKIKKIPYSKLPKSAVIDVSNNNDAEMDILKQFGLDIEANENVKEEALFVADPNAKFKQKMKENMAGAEAENMKKMTIL